jgi:Asp-tRNA(Asn)/Glu-tRNA(Gln) amidotransferase A subunit family amidase
MEPLWSMSATELAARIASRDISSREVLEAHLARIEEVNPYLNAIVRIMPDEARDAADRADAAVESALPLGPLHGVPCSI